MPATRSLRRALLTTVVTATTMTVLAGGPASADARTPRAMAPNQFFDAFDGPAGTAPDPSTWSYQTGGNWGNGSQSQAYTNRTANAALSGHGSLVITATGETYTGWDGITRDYTSARLISKQAVLYGSVSARIRMSGSQGAWPAFWTMGANYAQVRWPACGELDVMESLNDFPNLYGSFHGPVSGGYAGQYYNAGRMLPVSGGLGTGWHTYTATWRPGQVTFSLDGVAYSTVRKSDMPKNQVWAMNNPQNLILNIAVGGMAGEPAPPADFHATMEVDWVRVTNTTVS